MNVLRPNQIAQYEATKDSLEDKLNNKDIQDKQIVRAQLSRAEKEYESQRPKEFMESEVDAAVKERDELKQTILEGMPSQEEMRKAPPGAIGKHRDHEKRNKTNILRWKELQLRLHVGSEDPDIANIEMFRPKASSLSMDNAVIPGKNFHIPETVSVCKPYSVEDIQMLRERAPKELFDKIAMMTGEQRTILRQQYIETWVEEPDVFIAQVTPEVIAKELETITEDEAGSLDDIWPSESQENE